MTGRVVPVEERTHVAEVRRAATDLGRRVGLPDRRVDELALVTTEMGTNVLTHGGRGSVVLRHTPGAVEVLALDSGPGIEDVGAALRDGTSRKPGGPGLGLGAIQRLSDEWDLWTAKGAGTAMLARFRTPEDRPATGAVRVGALELPHPGEQVSGDALLVGERPGGARLAVVDGLGHGPQAAEASQAAVRVLTGLPPDAGPADALGVIDSELGRTRGAAASIVDLDGAQGRIVFAGIGNVTVALVGRAGSRGLVNHHGTLGTGASRPREAEEAWGAGELVVVHSDGVSARWDLGRLPGLARRDPALIAGLLWRDHGGRRDDATVAVARREVPRVTRARPRTA